MMKRKVPVTLDTRKDAPGFDLVGKPKLKTAYALKARMLNKVYKEATYDPAAHLNCPISKLKCSESDSFLVVFYLKL